MISIYEVLIRLDNRDVLTGETDRSAAQILASDEPVTLKVASYVKRHEGEASGNGHYNEINIDRSSIAWVVDL